MIKKLGKRDIDQRVFHYASLAAEVKLSISRSPDGDAAYTALDLQYSDYFGILKGLYIALGNDSYTASSLAHEAVFNASLPIHKRSVPF